MFAGLFAPLLLAPAFALTNPRAGVAADAGVGLGLGAAPLAPGLGAQLSVGVWRGRFDDAYALGRFWQLSLTGRFDVLADRPARLAGLLEVRRGTDVLVAGLAPFLAGGVVAPLRDDDAPPPGFTVRGGLIAKYRWHRHHGGTLRLEVGADVIGGDPSFTGAVLLGFAFARPLTKGGSPR